MCANFVARCLWRRAKREKCFFGAHPAPYQGASSVKPPGRAAILHLAVLAFNCTGIVAGCRTRSIRTRTVTGRCPGLAVDVLTHALHRMLQVIRGAANSWHIVARERIAHRLD